MSLLRALIDLIYPPRCMGCDAFLAPADRGINTLEGFFCRTCRPSLHPIHPPLCPVCGRPYSSGAPWDRVCEACLRRRIYFTEARAPYLYEGPLRKAIQRLKYEGKSHYARALAPALASFAATWLAGVARPLILPVPLHPKRLRERGYNQSVLLARPLAKALPGDLDCLTLVRTKYTRPQAGLDGSERRRNVRQAFAVRHRALFKERDVILVDDVATTGTTLNECARVLRKAGAGRIFCLSLAKTPSTC